MFLFFLVFSMPLCVSVYLCLVVTCWERADLLAFVCGVSPRVSLSLSHWYPGSGVILDLSISDLCTLTYYGNLQIVWFQICFLTICRMISFFYIILNNRVNITVADPEGVQVIRSPPPPPPFLNLK